MHSPSGSITQGTPVRTMAQSLNPNQVASMVQRQEAIHRPVQPRMPSGSITSGTPVNRDMGNRGPPSGMEGPRMQQLQWEQQRMMMEQHMTRPQQYPQPGMPFLTSQRTAPDKQSDVTLKLLGRWEDRTTENKRANPHLEEKRESQGLTQDP